jgi:antibiotic biosynthesis monooxygenase (ABM) superfamily enzyme
MYGTVARFKLKPGMEARLVELDRQEQGVGIPGYVGSYVYRMDNESNVYYLAVAFESKEAYVANATSPEQDARYREMRELFESDPEWHDGEIVSSYLAR